MHVPPFRHVEPAEQSNADSDDDPGRPPSSPRSTLHSGPVKPGGHEHVYRPWPVLKHVPPFLHGA